VREVGQYNYRQLRHKFAIAILCRTVNKDTFRIHLCEQVILSTSSSPSILRPVFRDLRTVRVALSLREQARRVRAAPPRDRDIIVESPGSDASADASKPHTGTAVMYPSPYLICGDRTKAEYAQRRVADVPRVGQPMVAERFLGVQMHPRRSPS
jgi:hypothetical protein